MKKFYNFFLFLLCFVSTTIESSTEPIDYDNLEKSQLEAISLIFTNTIPTTSINESIIDTIYGPSGLNIKADDLIKIKQTYCYLEFLTKIEKIKKDPALIQHKKSFENFLQPSPNNRPLMPTQTLVQSPGWKSVEVTNEEILTSSAWQLFLKTMIVSCYDNTADTLKKLNEVNNQLSTYIPNIEVGLYDVNCTRLRLYGESLQLQSIMQNEIRKRYQKQSLDWADTSSAEINSAVTDFKTTDFYNYMYNPQKFASKKNKNPVTPSPIREEIIAYFMLFSIQDTVNKTTEKNNVNSVLNLASSINFIPNFYLQNISDLACMSDFLSLQDLIAQNKYELAHPAPLQPAKKSDNVKIQSITDFKAPDPAAIAEMLKNNDQNKIEKYTSEIDQKIFGMILSTDSMYEISIDKIYGNQGLNLTAKQIDHIKKAYCYLEFLVKMKKIQDNPSLAENDALLQIFLDPSKKDRTLVPTKELAQNKIWKAMKVTQNEIKESNIWQKFLKTMIADIFDQQASFLENITMANNQLFDYIPNIENFYHDPKVIQLRLYIESIQLEALMLQAQQKRYLQECADWKSVNEEALTAVINQFKTTEFYKNTHNSDNSLAQQNTSTAQKNTDEYIGFFMLISIQGDVYKILNKNNAFSFLSNASSLEIAPNFFRYNISDASYIDDYLSLKELIDKNEIVLKQDPGNTQEVVVQGIGKAFKKFGKKTGKAFEKLGNDTNKGLHIAAVGMVESIKEAGNGMTTGMIEFSAGLTYAAFSVAWLFDQSYNPDQEANKVRAKMEKSRALMNGIFTAVFIIVLLPVLAPVILLSPALAVAFVVVALYAMDAYSEELDPYTVGLMMHIFEGIGIVANAMTTGLIEISVSLTYVAFGVAWLFDQSYNPDQEAAKVRADMEQYRGTINVVMGIVLMIIVTVVIALATAGAGVSISTTLMGPMFLMMIAMDIVFGAFSLMAAIAQDMAAILAVKSEHNSIVSLWTFIENNKIAIAQTQKNYLGELYKKHQAAVENQVFGFNYYKNYLNSSINNVHDQIAQALAQQYISMLTPDDYGLRMSDIGSTWGLHTQFTYLYPSQGFLSTTLGRPDFPYAQEIAQAPLASENNTDPAAENNVLVDTQADSQKLWFNQRAVAVVNQSPDKPLDVEIKFRVLYNLKSAYHVGLYLGGKLHDYNSAEYMESLEDTGTIELDAANLAKMFVLKRDEDDKSPTLALYENEGRGWMAKHPVDKKLLNNSEVYHMSANLNKDKLTVSFWPESNIALKWSTTTTVSPCDQRTFGIIFSGAAIEWGVVKPGLSITENSEIRPRSDEISEAQRERNSKAMWKILKNPLFGSMNLASIGNQYLFKGQYIYSRKDASLIYDKEAVVDDMVVFATSSAGEITNVGVSPTPENTSKNPNVIISLITGIIYDKTGKTTGQQENMWELYSQVNGPFPQTLHDSILQAKITYQKQISFVSFGDASLEIINNEALQKSLFIYSSAQTIPVQDLSDQIIMDYLITADIVNDSLGSKTGMAPSTKTQGMVSLITGNLFKKSDGTQINSGYSVLEPYISKHNWLPNSVKQMIESSKNAYYSTLSKQAAQEKNLQDLAAAQNKKSSIASQTISLSSMLKATPPSTNEGASKLTNNLTANSKTAKNSLDSRRDKASEGIEVQVGGLGSTIEDSSGFELGANSGFAF